MSKIPKDTNMLILNTGAWYNRYQGVENSALVYEETMTLLKPIIQQFLANGTVVVWVPLPWNFDESREKPDSYEWKAFVQRNELAKRDLMKIGVIYLDGVEWANHFRRLNDSHASPDGLHSCNPGPTGIPSFINQAVFHLTAMSLLQKPHHPNTSKKHSKIIHLNHPSGLKINLSDSNVVITTKELLTNNTLSIRTFE